MLFRSDSVSKCNTKDTIDSTSLRKFYANSKCSRLMNCQNILTRVHSFAFNKITRGLHIFVKKANDVIIFSLLYIRSSLSLRKYLGFWWFYLSFNELCTKRNRNFALEVISWPYLANQCQIITMNKHQVNLLLASVIIYSTLVMKFLLNHRIIFVRVESILGKIFYQNRQIWLIVASINTCWCLLKSSMNIAWLFYWMKCQRTLQRKF